MLESLSMQCWLHRRWCEILFSHRRLWIGEQFHFTNSFYSELLYKQMINGGCGANAYCMPTGPAQRKCICNENYIGDGFTCTGTLRQVITARPSLAMLNSYMNVCSPDFVLEA